MSRLIVVSNQTVTAKVAGCSPRRRLRASSADQKLLTGVDRLEYTTGIAAPVKGFRRFLAAHPESQGRVSSLQIAPQSRSGVGQSEALEREIAAFTGNIAGDWGGIGWSPLRYVKRAFGQQILAGLYRQAQVALVTLLRDGMKLVAKKYVASQDPGKLVLSHFAGAVFKFLVGALIASPYDLEAVHHATSMPRSARKARQQRVMEVLRHHMVFDWCDALLKEFRPIRPPPTRAIAECVPKLP